MHYSLTQMICADYLSSGEDQKLVRKAMSVIALKRLTETSYQTYCFSTKEECDQFVNDNPGEYFIYDHTKS